ncbi:MAG: amidohydrolase family protein [Acidobacteria bacterium]|nr:amidohydrolase family protein [Acidobacteriota bacterium]
MPLEASQQSNPPRRFVIDSHQHYDPKPDYFERLVRVYKPRNAMVCVNGFRKDLGAISKAAAAHPDVVIPYGRIQADDPAALAEIDEFAAAGCKGVKMHSPRHNWDDPQYFPLYARIEHHGMLALFHTGIASHIDQPQFTSMERMRPSHLDTLTRAFPKLYIQGAHLGNPWYEEAAEAARWGPRLYFDLTGSTLIKKASNLSIFREYLWWEGPGLHSSPHAVYAFEKVVFGTDEPPENLAIVLSRYEAVLDACKVPETSRKKIYGETLAHILGIRPRN